VLEPYLIQQGYLMRTSRGRMATRMAYEYFGLQTPRKMESLQPMDSLQPMESLQPLESLEPIQSPKQGTRDA